MMDTSTLEYVAYLNGVFESEIKYLAGEDRAKEIIAEAKASARRFCRENALRRGDHATAEFYSD
ncbi:hypothetical protein [Corynebacterium renale]|uniref:Uncharacterized protein n=1 Tax=Corynebacterium renale TaxID=1724 RepID=A0A2A9DN90_9CORY|nr:hypothetical protein [Corynebacterium renale]PFG27422.1 hypothetical protein ATK06_0480 [Corynebacterium renale]SQI23419.1 Uncharacterised protein [Corynebacterium renale]